MDADAAAQTLVAVTASGADDLVADTLGRLERLHERWPPGTLTYRIAPLAVRVAPQGDDAFDVDVWYVGVVAGRGIPTYEEWVTQSYRLVWERDDWRIAREAEAPGPRPDPGRQSPASAAELEARLVGFEGLA